MKKPSPNFYNVLNWILGIFLCAFGVCLCAKADLGMSTLSAPAYIIYQYVSQFWSFYTHGMSDYLLQALILLITCLICWHFKPKWLLSFGVSVLSGICIDFCYLLLGGTEVYASLVGRVIAYVIGVLLIGFAVACLFRTNFPIAIPELAVKSISEYRQWKIERVKIVYDLSFLGLSLALSFLFFGTLKGIGIGTVISAVVNSIIIKFSGVLIDKWQTPKQPEQKTTEK